MIKYSLEIIHENRQIIQWWVVGLLKAGCCYFPSHQGSSLSNHNNMFSACDSACACKSGLGPGLVLGGFEKLDTPHAQLLGKRASIFECCMPTSLH